MWNEIVPSTRDFMDYGMIGVQDIKPVTTNISFVPTYFETASLLMALKAHVVPQMVVIDVLCNFSYVKCCADLDLFLLNGKSAFVGFIRTKLRTKFSKNVLVIWRNKRINIRENFNKKKAISVVYR